MEKEALATTSDVKDGKAAQTSVGGSLLAALAPHEVSLSGAVLYVVRIEPGARLE
jgi:hypothetical protein